MYLFVGVTLAMPQWRGGGGDKKTPMSFVISGCWKAVLTETICEAKGAARKLTAGTWKYACFRKRRNIHPNQRYLGSKLNFRGVNGQIVSSFLMKGTRVEPARFALWTSVLGRDETHPEYSKRNNSSNVGKWRFEFERKIYTSKKQIDLIRMCSFSGCVKNADIQIKRVQEHISSSRLTKPKKDT